MQLLFGYNSVTNIVESRYRSRKVFSVSENNLHTIMINVIIIDLWLRSKDNDVNDWPYSWYNPGNSFNGLGNKILNAWASIKKFNS